MDAGDGEAKKSEGDGNLCDRADPDVTGLAEPPPLDWETISLVPHMRSF